MRKGKRERRGERFIRWKSGLWWQIPASSHEKELIQIIVADGSAKLLQGKERYQDDKHDKTPGSQNETPSSSA
jgi:hypothetical protein